MVEKAKAKINETGDCIFNEEDVIDLLYSDPDLDISKLFFEDPSQYNTSVKDTGIGYKTLGTAPTRPPVEEFDRTMIENWHMPESYYQIDVKQWLLDKTQSEEERDRVLIEYKLFEQKNFI